MSQESQSELEKLRAMLGILFDHNPDGVCISDAAGNMLTNPVGAALVPALPQAEQTDASAIDPAKWSQTFGLFLPDGKTPHPIETLPLVRALRGEMVRDYELLARSPLKPEGIWLSVTASPLPNGSAVAVFRDISERKRLEEDLATRNAELGRQMNENRELIERLRLAVDELSTPILELGDDVLALPIVGVVDTVRSTRMMDKALSEVVNRRCRFVIIDITGVDVVDTSTADRFMKLARAIELLGAECVISGVQPAVAQTLTDLGVSFRGLTTQRNLKRALDFCMARRQQETRRASA